MAAHLPDDPRGAADPGAVADAFFRAIETNELTTVRDIYADDLQVWHSYDGATQDKNANLAMLAGLLRLGQPAYAVIERLISGDRAAQRHRLHISPHDGSTPFVLDAAIFLTVRGGRIVALDEFLDSGPVGRIHAAIAHAGGMAPTGRPDASIG